ncbi:MAG: STAS domain-containing protein [Actinomycetota bacterium]|nr:STAS domain-containing protein [Actinomycetota bacterium]
MNPTYAPMSSAGTGAPSTLDVSLLDCGRSALLALGGELDMATCGLLQAVLDDVLRSRRTPRVVRLVLDMSAVQFVDAAGISPVLHARAVLAKRRGVVEVRDPSASVRRLLGLLDLADLIAPAPPSTAA